MCQHTCLHLYAEYTALPASSAVEEQPYICCLQPSSSSGPHIVYSSASAPPPAGRNTLQPGSSPAAAQRQCSTHADAAEPGLQKSRRSSSSCVTHFGPNTSNSMCMLSMLSMLKDHQLKLHTYTCMHAVDCKPTQLSPWPAQPRHHSAATVLQDSAYIRIMRCMIHRCACM